MELKSLDEQVDVQIAATMENLLSELSHYRQQSEKLRKINTLYQRMAGILDLPAMIEAYSIWLMEFVGHELIGYHNPGRKRMHMFCSYHGPQRRQAIQLAQEVLEQDAQPPMVRADGFHVHKWAFNSTDCYGLLVMLRKGKPLTEDELQFIDESLMILADPLKRAIEYEEIFAQARKDSLTGLPNRFVFEERIGAIVEQANRHGRPLTLAALDLDHFKAVNDTMGHLMGDQVLKQVAEVLQRQIRLSDLLVRMGGDEFLLVLPDTAMEDARFLAERLCQAVEELNIVTQAGRLAVSIGLSEWKSGMQLDAWLERADDILYQAKANGRAQVAVN
ncbi:diguanylate cyclase [Desulfobulbus propionicus DSM 2032]|uniref:diguanylate cyclase n=1 Tax=Desulfobulbus propionicus (strain ATCC 33891 / DSM 2032 / VKM B-1956 / 1pr3) TaxID=577650 RepID=A0A7U3YLR6_DESPD|nr:GGDEF domain-containing protein [Desulfobulbus propionicus]ADW17720.1 diguanylate cyclase [Desulfobulbus propionicus DSM 2032]